MKNEKNDVFGLFFIFAGLLFRKILIFLNVVKKDIFSFVRVVSAFAICASFCACEDTKDDSPMRKYVAMYGSSTSEPVPESAEPPKVVKSDTVRVDSVPSSSSVVISSSSQVPAPVVAPKPVVQAPPVDTVVPEEKVDLCAEAPQGVLCDGRDGKTYRTVRFGDQLWMAENLNFAATDSWCYNNQEALCKKYGRLYKWTAALGLPDTFSVVSAADSLKAMRQGACPEGWHIPTNDEMKAFYSFTRQRLLVKDSLREGVGTSLKMSDGWEESSEVPAGSDRFNFGAKPAGYRAATGMFNYLGQDCNFWVASESAEPNRAPYWNLYFDNDDFLGVYTNLKSSAYSVRCLKD